jgi:YD repeat-containing protein
MKSFLVRLQPFLRGTAAVVAIFALTYLGEPSVEAQTTPELRGDVHFIDGTISTGATYNVFSGRISRRVVDLVVPGSVGMRPLSLQRVLYNLPVQSQPLLPTSLVGCSAQWNFNVFGYRIWIGPTSLNTYAMSLTYPDGTYAHADFNYQDTVVFFGTGDRVFLDAPTSVHNLVLQDGSVVNFNSVPGGGGWSTSTIADPYGLTTTYTSAYNADGTSEYRITDASGRWVRLVYNSNGPLRGETSTGEYVNYICDRPTYSPAVSPTPETQRLLEADYSDGTVAKYEYTIIYNGSTYMATLPRHCYDTRSTDLMQSVEYTFNSGDNSWDKVSGGLKGGLYDLIDVRLPGSSTPVSSRSGAGGNPSFCSYQETRGDGSTRIYTLWGMVGARFKSFTDGLSNSTNYDIQRFAGRKFDTTSSYSANPDTYTNVTNYTVTDALSRVTTVRYLLVPTQALISTPEQLTASYVAAIENPVKVTYADGTSKQIIYTDPLNPFYVAKTIDECGNATTYNRLPNGLVSSIVYADGSSENWTYNSFNEPLTHTQRNSATESWEYDSAGRLLTHWLANYSSKTAAIRYTYYPAGHVWMDRLMTVTDPKGNVTTTAYDLLFSSNGVQTTTPCAGPGRVSRITFADGSYRTFGYDVYGHKISVTDEAGNTTTNTYDSFGRLLTSTDPDNRTSTIVYGDTAAEQLGTADSLPKHTLTTLQRKTSFSYDKNRSLIGKIEGDGSSSPKSWSYLHDAVGNMLTQREQAGGTTGAEVWRDTTWTYDSRNRKLSEKTILQRSPEISRYSDWGYDAAGNLVYVLNPDNTSTRKLLDNMYRVSSAMDEMGKYTFYSYSYTSTGRQVKITDPNNNSYYQNYDAQDRQVSFQQSNPSGSGTESEITGYDLCGNVVSYTNRAGAIKTITYDVRNRPLVASWNDGVTLGSSTSYDLRGLVTQRSNANSTLSYSYDSAGQLIQETQAVTGAPTKIIDYQYDLDGSRTKMHVHTK